MLQALERSLEVYPVTVSFSGEELPLKVPWSSTGVCEGAVVVVYRAPEGRGYYPRRISLQQRFGQPFRDQHPRPSAPDRTPDRLERQRRATADDALIAAVLQEELNNEPRLEQAQSASFYGELSPRSRALMEDLARENGRHEFLQHL
eukprot:TRINITY_DN15252_c0_g1_i1.p1 TRINITY_DN15252_c0_g1~~TRINITY_DN15252_c0_g1_i1.p1  ORF type:complete len:147 (+),score=19.80 TRINITY_DN15252_c0_g1_i1:198-638(+)